MTSSFYQDINEVLKELRTSNEGLSLESIKKRQAKYGLNVIRKQQKTPEIIKYLKQFTDLLAVILLVAASFSVLLGAFRDALIIFLIVVVNATISFVQEYKAEKAIDALKKYLPQMATVIRAGDETQIKASELVPGDIILLSEGLKVPADIRLLSANALVTNEAAITGESESQSKKALASEKDGGALGDLAGSVLMGTQILSGDGVGVVVATGMNTQFGQIARATTEQVETKSPLQKEIDQIAKTIAKATFWIILVLMGIYFILEGRFLLAEAFEFSIGVASALVPEGLPATVSIALAIGIQRMARRRAAIRRLSAVETLGETNVIVTDKTGTLTKDEMTVKEIFSGGKDYHVKGVGYALSGEITTGGRLCKGKDLEDLKNLFMAVTMANKAEIDGVNHSQVEFMGDSTELALLVAAEKAGLDTYQTKKKTVITQEIPFTAESKFMAVVTKTKTTEMVYLKGATNVVLSKVNRILKDGRVQKITEKDRAEIVAVNDKYSEEALRVIAAAYKPKDEGSIEKGLIFLGLFGIIDPPREDVAEAVRLAKMAGIKIIMATGDYGLTGAAVAQRIKLAEDPKIFTGEELDNLGEKELEEALKEPEIIFSRVNPIHKLRLVKTLQKMGNIVAVTGDGVNDAPALKKADIGVAMGITGTDVSKEAAEMVSLNDSFASIIWAVKEGRIVYENIKKVTRYVFTSNIAEFFAVCLGLVLGIAPIFAIQILLVDLGAEVFPALALAGDPEEDDLMNRPPREQKDILFGKETILYILRSGGIMGVMACLAFLTFGYLNGWQVGTAFTSPLVYTKATTVTYATIAICQYFNAFSIRSANEPIYKLLHGSRRLLIALGVSIVFITSMIYVPFLHDFSKMASIGPAEWGIVIFFGLVYAVFLEVIKRFRKPKKITNLIATKLMPVQN